MRSVQDLLSQFFDETQLNQVQDTNSFFSAWTEIAGKDLAAHSRIYDIVKGTVMVSVDHPGWMQMLQMQKRGILKKIQKRYPELAIQDMRMLHQPKASGSSVPVLQSREEESTVAEDVHSENSGSGSQWVRGLEDEALKAVFLSLEKRIHEKGRG